MCVLLGQVLHRISHLRGGFLVQESICCLFVCPFPPHARAQQHQGPEEDIKIVLGLKAEPHQGTTHYLGLAYLLVIPGAHSNKKKQTKTSSEIEKIKAKDAFSVRDFSFSEIR